MTISVTVEVQGLRDLRGRFARYDEELAQYRLEEASGVLPRMTSRVVQFAPVGKTGEFAKSISGFIGRLANRVLEVRFKSSDPRAKYIIPPTSPHTIAAVRARSLRFFVGDQKVFAKWVQHPGTKGNDFIDRAFSANKEEFIHAMNRAGVRAVVSLAGRR